MNTNQQAADGHESGNRVIDQHLARLTEHFDAVQILATWVLPNGNTEGTIRGTGNYCARIGLAKEFLDKDTAITHHNEGNSTDT